MFWKFKNGELKLRITDRFLPALIVIIAIMMISACNTSAAGGSPADVTVRATVFKAPEETSQPAGTAQYTPTKTLTPTVTQTASPSPYPLIYNASSTPLAITWGSYPAPSYWPALQIPPPVGLLDQPENQQNILIMGIDQVLSDGSYRTDAMILLTLNLEDGTASMTTFPRDLYVYIPGWTMQRLNSAHAHGGFELTALTFEYNFGVRLDHWVLVDFEGFIKMIDALGGIDVHVARAFDDPEYAFGKFSVNPGIVHMDGRMARWYVRSRYYSNDIDRNRRQREVLNAIFERAMALDVLERLPDLFYYFRRSYETDMVFEDLLKLVPIALLLTNENRIFRYAIGGAQTEHYIIPRSGAQVLLLNREAVLQVMNRVLNSPSP